MRKVFLFVSVLNFLVFTGCQKDSPSASAGSKRTDLAANISLPLLNGHGQWELASLLGKKAVLLKFFTTWCPYCNKSTPYIQSFYEKNKANNFEVIGINLEEDKGKVEKFQKKFGVTFPIVLAKDTSLFSESYPVRFLPTFYLISREGVVLRKFEGFHPDILDDISKSINNL